MTIVDWVNFWFRGPLRYKGPPKRDNKKRKTCLRDTYNPFGVIDKTSLHSKEWNMPFSTLHIEVDAQGETYLAAFLSYWLCNFMLLEKEVILIHLSTFKVASLIVTNQHFCLTVPVLANIYQGLRKILIVTDFNTCVSSFLAHYVYGWLTETFDINFTSNR